MERTSRKIPVTDRQFLWVQDDDKGEVTLHVGPTMVSPTAADRVVVDDGAGGFREDHSGRPQMMVEVTDTQYAVLFNPLVEGEGLPNGSFRAGRNESRPLANGTRAMIPGPCSFWLRPGQRIEVREAHDLASDQYLVVKVYGQVDKEAPFYDLTARSAAITRSTSENVGDDKPSSTRLEDLAPVELRRGQLIVIRGLDTQLYIPPSGVDVVPDTSIDPSGLGLTAEAARKLLAQLPAAAPVTSEALDVELANEALQEIEEEEPRARAKQRKPKRMPEPRAVDQSARSRQRLLREAQQQMTARPVEPASPPKPSIPMQELLASPEVRRALEVKAKQARLIRRAVVLGEKEYCVIIDADGKREIQVGPARVFPGPYDQFMVRGSRNRIYDAYELLPQRALWLRVIAPISRTALAERLPAGVELERESYTPGDELLLTGVSTFFFPFNEIEVLSPATGQAVVGNDHASVFIEAIGIDQRSGIYVRDLTTGEARLVRGKRSYLVDPRKEVQITRTVPRDDWNLWIAAQEPHKATDQPVTTPWAVSIMVPHNTAVLVTSADSQRVVEGPCVELLGYEERLTPVTLSMGTPKSDERLLRTCFLRTVGNRVSDVITIETKDFVRVSTRVSYSVTFIAGERERWFDHENYIQLICDHLRSLVRGRFRSLSLSDLWVQIAPLVRDTILGERTPEGRKGRTFEEIGALVTEVEVLSSVIEDEAIAKLMSQVQSESVTLQIGDRQAQERLASARLRADLQRQHQELKAAQAEREAELRRLERRLGHEHQLAEIQNDEARRLERQQHASARETESQATRLKLQEELSQHEQDRQRKDAEAQAAAKRTVAEVEIDLKQRLAAIEVQLVEAQSAATVAERNAVQRGLIEAMTALGDKIMLSEAAQNMNLVSLFKGKDVASLLLDVLNGTRAAPTLRKLLDSYGPEADAPAADTRE